MRQLSFLLIVLFGALAALAYLVPAEVRSTSLQVVERDAPELNILEKRKGGGGGGKGGGSSGGHSSSSGSSGSSGGMNIPVVDRMRRILTFFR
jgi:uncharacterized membrane protein YgcG